MENFGFEVTLNGQKLCRAGFENEHYVASCIVDTVRRKIEPRESMMVHVGGLNSDTHQHVQWIMQEVKLGDTITIKVIQSPFDPPATIKEPDTEEFLLQQKIKYFHRLKEELKDHI